MKIAPRSSFFCLLFLSVGAIVASENEFSDSSSWKSNTTSDTMHKVDRDSREDAKGSVLNDQLTKNHVNPVVETVASSIRGMKNCAESVNLFFAPITKELQPVFDNKLVRFVGFMGGTIGLSIGTGVLMVYILSKMQASSLSIENGIKPVSPEDLITFKDYIGTVPQEAIDLVDQLKHPYNYSRLGVAVTKGILLYGPPGGGKTYLARAIAGEVGCPFIAINGTQFSETFVGQSKMSVKKFFQAAVDSAQQSSTKTAIIFIDEIDAIGARSAFGVNPISVETINTLLSEMDGFSQRKDVNIVVMGATNLIELIDKALMRSGRLDYKIEVPYFDKENRERLVAYFLQKCPSEQNVDASWLAEITHEFSAADIKLLFESAGRVAARNKKKLRDADSFAEAFIQVKKSLILSMA